MTVEAPTEEAQFQKVLLDSFKEISPADPLYKWRQKSWDRFTNLGLASRKTESYQYIKLRNLYARNFDMILGNGEKDYNVQKNIHSECKNSYLVLVNGCYRPDLSQTSSLPSSVVITSLSSAYRTYGALINNSWTRVVKEEKDTFALLNSALYQEGIFIYVPPKVKCESPLQVLYIVDGSSKNVLTMPRVHVQLGAFSECDLVSGLMWEGNGEYFSNQYVEISLEEGARLNYSQSVLVDERNQDGWVFESLRAFLKKQSQLKVALATNGQTTVRHDYYVALAGEGADAHLSGVWFLPDSKEAHVNVIMDHQKPYCHSMQLFKGVLTQTAKSSFQGKILVQQAAQQTQAYQLNNNLLLSDGSIADSKPGLEIFADDVKASHGATVGQLDKDQLFYLKTRGFSDAEAKNCLIHGFCEEVLSLLTIPSLKEKVELKVLNCLSPS